MSKSLRYNEGKPQWSLVDFKSIEPLVRVMEYGAHKYSVFTDQEGNDVRGLDISLEDASSLTLKSSGRENWKISLDPMKCLESASRHLFALMSGEEIDPESGKSHAGHLHANIMFYTYHTNKNKELSNE